MVYGMLIGMVRVPRNTRFRWRYFMPNNTHSPVEIESCSFFFWFGRFPSNVCTVWLWAHERFGSTDLLVRIMTVMLSGSRMDSLQARTYKPGAFLSIVFEIIFARPGSHQRPTPIWSFAQTFVLTLIFASLYFLCSYVAYP